MYKSQHFAPVHCCGATAGDDWKKRPHAVGFDGFLAIRAISMRFLRHFCLKTRIDIARRRFNVAGVAPIRRRARHVCDAFSAFRTSLAATHRMHAARCDVLA
jgi:hypothetical protein